MLSTLAVCLPGRYGNLPEHYPCQQETKAFAMARQFFNDINKCYFYDRNFRYLKKNYSQFHVLGIKCSADPDLIPQNTVSD